MRKKKKTKKEEEKRKKKKVLEINDFKQSQTGSVLNLETEFREWALAGLAVQNNFTARDLALHGPFDVGLEASLPPSLDEKFQRGRSRTQSGCNTS